MTAVLASALLTAVTTMGGVLMPLAIVLGAAVFAVLLVTSVRPVRHAPTRMRLPRVAVAVPALAGEVALPVVRDDVPVLGAGIVEASDRSSGAARGLIER